MSSVTFPEGFIWGCATSAYQIEGAPRADNKGHSIWDEFVRRPGTIRDGTNADVAANHYQRVDEDLDLLQDLAVGAYRFSVAWPRVIPDGDGAVNHDGLDFYDRLVDGLLERGIEPFVTLFHWDLPLALERDGGWTRRRTARVFARYAEVVVRRLGDRVRRWMTLNEPLTVIGSGYLGGRHAPGHRSIRRAAHAVHTMLLGHGLATQVIRAECPRAEIGLANAFAPAYPATRADERLARRISYAVNGLFMDPIFKRRYPPHVRHLIRFLNRSIRPGDFDTIATPIDFVGVNHYTRYIARRTLLPFIGYRLMRPIYEGVVFTEMDWEVYPSGLYDTLDWIRREYNNPRTFITENGAAFDDRVRSAEIHDHDRIDYLSRYLFHLHRAMEHGCHVDGYFVWSFLDNFEWEHGLSKRFGLVHVDYATLQRTVKMSGHWYRDVCRSGIVPVPADTVTDRHTAARRARKPGVA